MTEDIKPCPHCGGEDIRFNQHITDRSPTNEIWSMCCYECGATFPNRFKRELLVDAWNCRTEQRRDGDRQQESVMRYRITGGHPIFPFWVEDTWCDCDIMAYFSTYEAAENWVRTETAQHVRRA